LLINLQMTLITGNQILKFIIKTRVQFMTGCYLYGLLGVGPKLYIEAELKAFWNVMALIPEVRVSYH